MTPFLYSFRRCPYAIRARLALDAAEISYALREVHLRRKPQAFLEASPSATVPCLVAGDLVIDESLDIMIWALEKHDPSGWLDMPADGHALISRCDGPFKRALDRTKYASRYPDEDPFASRAQACQFLEDLEAHLSENLFGHFTLADAAILPFVRQFAFIDKAWFDARPWPNLHHWLAQFLASSRFTRVMEKHALWVPGANDIAIPKKTSKTG